MNFNFLNKKPSSKSSSDSQSSKRLSTRSPKVKSDTWDMSPLDALKVNYIDHHPSSK